MSREGRELGDEAASPLPSPFPFLSPSHTRQVRIVEANCDGRPVLLTSHPRMNCSDHYRGAGPCCKANFAFWCARGRALPRSRARARAIFGG